MAGVLLAQSSYKATAEWKEEIVCLDPGSRRDAARVRRLPRRHGASRIPPDEDPREVFADWLIAPDNPWFARSIVNRIWAG